MGWFKFSRLGKVGCATSILGLTGIASYSAYKRYSPLFPFVETTSKFPYTLNNQLLLSSRPTKAFAASVGGPLDQAVSRSVHFVRDTSGLHLTLFQFQTCPFCCKVRAYLDFRGISYDIVEVNSVFRTQVKWTPYKKVPILVSSSLSKEKSGEMVWFQMNDSSVIISSLETLFSAGDQGKRLEDIVALYPAFDTTDLHTNKPKVDFLNKYSIMYGKSVPTKVSQARSEEAKWREWVDTYFVHLLAPNVYRTLSEAFEAFNYVSEIGDWERLFPTWERLTVIYVGSIAMYLIGKRLQKRHQLDSDVRTSLYKGCKTWMQALGSRDFMGGNEPSLADLSLFGILSSIEGCSAFADAMNHNPAMFQWYSRTKLACTQNTGSSHFQQPARL